MPLLITSMILLHSVAGECGEVRAKYHFKAPAIEKTAGGYSLLHFPRSIQAGVAGGPSCPYTGASILLPPGETIDEVSILRKGWKEIASPVRLHPRQHVRPGSIPDQGEGLLVLGSAYSADRLIQPPLGSFTTRFMRGHPIATGTFSPISYNPVTGRAGYHSEIEVVIRTSPGREAADAGRLLRDDDETLSRLAGIVDNPLAAGIAAGSPPLAGKTASSGMSPTAGCDGEYDLLIVTTALLQPALEPLKEFYDRRGLITEILTVEAIEAGYSGADTPEKIRNAVTDRYTTSGISHLLLAGDCDIGTTADVPCKGLYCAVQSSSLYEDDNIPSDIYYGALDGDWNADGDTLFGEPGEADLYAEISVGRMPVDSPTEAAAMVNKTMMYQESPVTTDIRRALMLGEHLYSSPETWGGDEMDQLIGYCDAYGFVTTGIPVDFNITKYYDRDLGSWAPSTVWTEVNTGTGWVNHAGHSNYTAVMGIGRSSVTTENFTNDGITAGFPINYTYGCYAGAFDMDDAIAELMVTIETFASAMLCHSRYGWFTEGTTNGPSHHFQREFYDAVFTEGITALGEALVRAKDETVPFLDLPDEYEPGAHRWCFYCLNLLGDPAMKAWTDTILPIYATHAAAIGRSDAQFFAEAGQPGIAASLYAEGVSFGSAISDISGHITIDLCDTVPAGIDSLELTLTAHNRQHYRTTLPVVELTSAHTPIARLGLMQNHPNPFNPATTIRFELPEKGLVDLSIYDAAGRRVSTVLHLTMDAGPHSVAWAPKGLSSGIYFYVLKAGDRMVSRKAVLLR